MSASRLSLGRRTPEAASSGIKRQDSKHVLNTCHGITASGSPCRRRLPSNTAILRAKCTKKGGIYLAQGQSASIFVCWQHEDQAQQLEAQFANQTRAKDLYRRSLQSLFEELDLEDLADVDDDDDMKSVIDFSRGSHSIGLHYANAQESVVQATNCAGSTRQRPRQTTRAVKKRLSEVRHGDNAGLAERSDSGQQSKVHRREGTSSVKPVSSTLLRSLFGCFMLSEGRQLSQMTQKHGGRPLLAQRAAPVARDLNGISDRSAVPTTENCHNHPSGTSRSRMADLHTFSDTTLRHDPTTRRKAVPLQPQHAIIPSSSVSLPTEQRIRRHRHQSGVSNAIITGIGPLTVPMPRQRRHLQPSLLSANDRQRHGQSLIIESQISSTNLATPRLPPNADDKARLAYAKLLTQMSQSISSADGEGYIYMFWQTEMTTTQAETDAATSIAWSGDQGSVRAQDERVLQRRFFQTSANATIPSSVQRSIALKIGMAKNVHQRILQWQKQCGRNITLLKYYPQVTKGDDRADKVLCVKRVERLIHLHLEMLNYRIYKECHCGTEHREWFEIPGNAKAIKEVDSIIRQWVAWGKQRSAT